MQNQFSVADIVKRMNRRLLLLCVLIIVALIAVAAVFSNYLYNFISGPFELSVSEVAAMNEIGDQRFVTVTGEDSFDLGYELVETDDRGNEKVKANYAVLQVGDRLLIVQTPDILGENVPRQYTGELIPISAEFERDVVSDVERQVPNIRGLFLPFMMKEHNYRMNGYLGLGAGGIVLLACLYGLFTYIRRSSDPNRHPIMQDLAKVGDLTRIVPHLEHEMNHTQYETHNKDVHLTKTWLVKSNLKSGLVATPHRDLVWVYKKVTQHRTNGINTGKTYTAELHNRYGKSIIISGKEPAVDSIIEAIYPHAPWAIYGYNDQIKIAWNKDRANVIAAVDQRRESAQNGTAPQPQPTS